MRVHNIRHGFATNSSSSHSILILPPGTPPPPSSHGSNWGDYGWDDFTLTELSDKEEYYRAQMGYVTGSWGNGNDEPSIDHQSVWGDEGLSITDRTTGAPTNSPEVAAFLHQLISMNRVIILGGNDNSDGHPLLSVFQDAGAVALAHRDSWTLVRDPKGHFVLFDRRSGTKLRMTHTGEEPPAKGTWPELVDIKITDYCPYGCSYCYQGSTPQGRHAPLAHLEALAQRFCDSGVLEVALGGGEPTLHPDFARIVEAFHSAGVTVNVTSRNVTYWAEIPEVPVSAVAFSVDTAEQIRGILERFHAKYPPFQVHFQVVVGTVSVAEFEQMMEAAEGHRLTLLGYKDTGRGAAARSGLPVHNAPNQTEWIAPWTARVQACREGAEAWEAKRQKDLFDRDGSYWKASGGSHERLLEQRDSANPCPQPEYMPNLAIDTTLASLCKNELKKVGVPPISFHTSEGAFSMYINAVTQEAGPCSYAPALMSKYTLDSIWDDYARIPAIDGGK